MSNTEIENLSTKGISVLTFLDESVDAMMQHSVAFSSLPKITVTTDKSQISDEKYEIDDEERITLSDYPFDDRIVQMFDINLTLIKDEVYQQTDENNDSVIFVDSLTFKKSNDFEYDTITKKIYLKSSTKTLLCLVQKDDKNTLQYLEILRSEDVNRFRFLFDCSSQLSKVVISYFEKEKKVYKNIYTFLGNALEEETSNLVFSTTGCKQFTLVTPRVQ